MTVVRSALKQITHSFASSISESFLSDFTGAESDGDAVVVAVVEAEDLSFPPNQLL